jgi:hypothetical protein
MTNQFKSFMNSLWNCTDVVVPGLGTIVSTRAKYGTDIEAMLLDNGTIRLIDGTELFDQFPNLFQKS